MNRTCEVCGSEFKRRNARQRFCSTACRDASMQKRESLTCEHCGKQFSLPPWEVARGRGKYCGQVCFHAAQEGTVRLSIRKRETRTCVVCGKPFEVGGRAKHRSQETCSAACGNLTRYRRGASALALQPTDAAYLAGIIDGEGSIMVLSKRDTCIIKISVANTFVGLIEWLTEVTGIGSVVMTARASEKHKTGYHWQCYSEAAESLLKQILPYLRIKRAQAELALSVQERLRDARQKAERAWQQEAIATMQALNRRGPKGEE